MKQEGKLFSTFVILYVISAFVIHAEHLPFKQSG